MSGQSEENLRELFEKFFNAEQAERAAQDVQKTEQILREHPAPEPDRELIADIKGQITARLLHRQKHSLREIAYKVASVAAAVIVLAAMMVRLFEKGGGQSEILSASLIPREIWESDDIATDDAELVILTTEIERMEDEVVALELGENGSNGDRAAEELEMELIAINSDFWKG